MPFPRAVACSALPVCEGWGDGAAVNPAFLSVAHRVAYDAFRVPGLACLFQSEKRRRVPCPLPALHEGLMTRCAVCIPGVRAVGKEFSFLIIYQRRHPPVVFLQHIADIGILFYILTERLHSLNET